MEGMREWERDYLLDEISGSIAHRKRNSLVTANTSFFLAHLSTSSALQLQIFFFFLGGNYKFKRRASTGNQIIPHALKWETKSSLQTLGRIHFNQINATEIIQQKT